MSQSNQLLFIKSNQADRRQGVDHYYFSNPLHAQRGKRILAELTEAEIPVSYYNVNSHNNTLSTNHITNG